MSKVFLPFGMKEADFEEMHNEAEESLTLALIIENHFLG